MLTLQLLRLLAGFYAFCLVRLPRSQSTTVDTGTSAEEKKPTFTATNIEYFLGHSIHQQKKEQ